jgi:WD40 repeat protein
VSWDLQTGGVISAIEWRGPRDAQVGNAHITYSMNGRMVAVLPQYKSFATISIYDIVSGVYMHDVDHGRDETPDLASGTPCVYTIWAHGESLRFATPEPAGITIWQVGFTPGATPTEVETISIPDNTVDTFIFKPRMQYDISKTQFNPALCRLAFVGTEDTFLVWDGRASKFLLNHTAVGPSRSMAFSPDGRFFAGTTPESEVYLWKESPTGYALFGKLAPNTRSPESRFSPNSESIITFRGSTIQLWHTQKSITPTTSSISTRPPRHTGSFLLGFLPDRPLAVIARKKNNTVTVCDLKSGDLQLSIDTSIEVYGLRSVENTIVVIGDEKAITWNLPEGDFLPNASMNVKDSARTTNFRGVENSTVFAASISPDLRYVALAGYCEEEEFLDIYSTESPGWKIRGEARAFELWFAPGGHDIWCATDDEAKVFTITQDTLNPARTVADIEDGLLGCPWGSSHGYKVSHDGWVLGMGGKRLLMLSPLWKSQFKVDRVWNGKFLALLHDELTIPVILELEP